MKAHIQSGIESPRRRSGGDAPGIGRVPRMRGGSTSSTGGRRLRRRGGAKPKRVMLTWSVMLSAVTLVVLGVSFSLWMKTRVATGEIALISDKAAINERVVSRFPSPSRELALEQVRRTLSNRDPDQFEAFFRMGSATRAEVLDFLKSSESHDGPVERYEWLSSMDADGLLLEGVLVVYANHVKPVERIAFLTPDESGNWKLDYEAFARSTRPTWTDLLAQRANEGLVRVFVGHDFYFNGLYAEKEWLCYTIASPDTEELLRGYCKVGSPEAERMEQLFSQGQKRSRATLVIRHDKAAESKQFEITRIVAGDWVVAETPARRG